MRSITSEQSLPGSEPSLHEWRRLLWHLSVPVVGRHPSPLIIIAKGITDPRHWVLWLKKLDIIKGDHQQQHKILQTSHKTVLLLFYRNIALVLFRHQQMAYSWNTWNATHTSSHARDTSVKSQQKELLSEWLLTRARQASDLGLIKIQSEDIGPLDKSKFACVLWIFKESFRCLH